jgi:hypothetical protein
MVQRTGEQGFGNILFVQNNFYFDAFFLKAIGMLYSLLWLWRNIHYVLESSEWSM